MEGDFVRDGEQDLENQNSERKGMWIVCPPKLMGKWIETSSQERSDCWAVITFVAAPRDMGQIFLITLYSLEEKVKCFPESHPLSSCMSRMSKMNILNRFHLILYWDWQKQQFAWYTLHHQKDNSSWESPLWEQHIQVHAKPQEDQHPPACLTSSSGRSAAPVGLSQPFLPSFAKEGSSTSPPSVVSTPLKLPHTSLEPFPSAALEV